MKIAHFSDLHFCDPYLAEVRRCFHHAVSRACNEQCGIGVITGDLFDRRLDVHSPAVSALLAEVYDLASYMPVIILQGTFSHDVPGSLDVFRTLTPLYPVWVADRISQVVLIEDANDGLEWIASHATTFTKHELDDLDGAILALFSCLPAIHKGALAATVGADEAAEAAGDAVHQMLRAFAPANEIMRSGRPSIPPTVLLSHGTVVGSVTEQGVPMHGLDHEFTEATLFASEAAAVMLGHIHKHQSWSRDGMVGAYPGSIGRLHFGEVDPKGWLRWEFSHDGQVATLALCETPAKRLVEHTFEGPPDMEIVKRIAAEAKDAHVRLRWSVDEEHAHSVDRAAIEELFEAAAELKCEPRVLPIQRQRAAGITQATGMHERLDRWIEVTDSRHHEAELMQRLALLQSETPVEKLVALEHLE